MRKLMLVLFFAAIVFAGCQKKEAAVATDEAAMAPVATATTDVAVSTEAAATPAATPAATK